MSIIKSIKQVLGLGPAAQNHFWDGSVANQLTLKRGTPDAPGTELLKFLNGIASFPNQGQSLTPNGYIKLPGGLIVQWVVVNGTGGLSSAWPIVFPTAVLGAVATPADNSLGWPSGAILYIANSGLTVDSVIVGQVGGSGGTASARVIGIGY